MKKKILIFTAVLLLIMTACFPEAQNVQECVTSTIEPSGFWMGLWHGIILPISFIWGLFDHSVTIYDVVNNGNWYNFGFVLGAGALLGGSSS